jgi:tRNA (cytidine/uridine-2'-O-)-methyltransferase
LWADDSQVKQSLRAIASCNERSNVIDARKLNVWDDFSSFIEKMQPKKNEVKLFTKNGRKSFRELSILSRMFLVFGSETKGLSDEITSMYEESTFHIPINSKVRCLNLSTTVGIALYESLRMVDPVHEWR